ncbi:MAG: cytochrome c biogenesis CcdA family protein [Bacteroidota bacterium]
MQGTLQVTATVSFIAAFTGGILSFFSPCIFPVLPGYIGFLMGDTKSQWTKIIKSLGFILGLSIIFIGLGALSGLIGSALSQFQFWISLFGGAFIIILALTYLNWIKLPSFTIFKKNTGQHKATGFWSAVLLGILISFVWVPCVSPVLGSILVIAANSTDILKGTALLTVYSLGMGIPLFLLAMFVGVIYKYMPKIMQYESLLKKIGGVLLLVVGVLMMTGQLNNLQI